jgi:hypothetical protein
MMALVVVVDVFFEERVRFWFGREVHGTVEEIHRLGL